MNKVLTSDLIPEIRGGVSALIDERATRPFSIYFNSSNTSDLSAFVNFSSQTNYESLVVEIGGNLDLLTNRLGSFPLHGSAKGVYSTDLHILCYIQWDFRRTNLISYDKNVSAPFSLDYAFSPGSLDSVYRNLCPSPYDNGLPYIPVSAPSSWGMGFLASPLTSSRPYFGSPYDSLSASLLTYNASIRAIAQFGIPLNTSVSFGMSSADIIANLKPTLTQATFVAWGTVSQIVSPNL